MMSKKPLTLASRITIGRIFIIPFFIATVMYYTPQKDYLRFVALAAFLVAVTTDAIDGYIARVYCQKSTAGAVLDPLADKLLLISAFICLYNAGPLMGGVRFPAWLVVGVVSRDVILLIGAIVLYLLKGSLKIEPSPAGKASSFFQVFCVIGIFLQWYFSIYLWVLAAAFALISGTGYIRTGIRILNEV